MQALNQATNTAVIRFIHSGNWRSLNDVKLIDPNHHAYWELSWHRVFLVAVEQTMLETQRSLSYPAVDGTANKLWTVSASSEHEASPFGPHSIPKPHNGCGASTRPAKVQQK